MHQRLSETWKPGTSYSTAGSPSCCSSPGAPRTFRALSIVMLHLWVERSQEKTVNPLVVVLVLVALVEVDKVEDLLHAHHRQRGGQEGGQVGGVVGLRRLRALAGHHLEGGLKK